MAVAMDTAMDMDIDFTEQDEELARLNAEAAAIEARTQAEAQQDAMKDVEEAPEEGEVDGNEIAPTKIHIRGLNNLTTKDVRQLVEEHYSVDSMVERRAVDWVDDSSANIVFGTEEAAAEALVALSSEEVTEPLQIRQAKRLSTHPNTDLLVRMAVASDVKVKGASKYSTFYVWNPQYDPAERAQRRKRRYDDDDSRSYRERGYKRAKYEDRYNRRRSDDSQTPFDVNLYDDAPAGAALAARISRPESRSSASSHGRRRVRYDHVDTDLFADKQKGRLRDRSASPARDGDGRYGFAEDQPQRQTAPPRAPRVGSDNRGARDSLRKELFPNKQPSTALTNGDSNGYINGSCTPDLFANSRPSRDKQREDLFPDKINGSQHRRQDARDLDVESAADKISQYHINNDGGGDYTYSRTDHRPPKGGDLFSRISGSTKPTKSDYGRLNASDDTEGFSFKGASGLDDGAGFSIMGASRQRAENPLVKELFPMKAGGGEKKKDLFDGRIKGRGGQRRRAEDLF